MYIRGGNRWEEPLTTSQHWAGHGACVTLWLSRSPLLLLPLALFLALFHPAVLDIGNAGWLIRGTDNGENALGMHAWLHDPAPGLLRTHLLNAPEGVPLLFTDSNPLLGLLLRPFAPLLPADAQFVGPWFLLCLVLQVYFAWLLLRRHAPSPVALWCAVALLAALPTLLNRFIHANLFAHWLILWALWRFADPRRAGSNRGWAVLIALTALIHNYLLVMVGAIWASAMLERFVAAQGASAPRVRARLVAGGAAIVAMVAGLALALGAGEPHSPAGNYGAFAMPLDALVNPGNPGFSRFLPAIEQRPGRGFEGFQYLGLGVLLLLALAALAAAGCRPYPRERRLLRRLAWLAPALVVLALLAVSNYPDVAGIALLRLPLPERLTDALDPVRASGRLFWPVSYVLVLVALLAAFRLGARRAALLLPALLAIQMLDVSGLFAAVRATTAEAPQRRLYARTPDPAWDRMIAEAQDVTLMPPRATRDLALFQEIAWRAAARGRPVRHVYAARDSLRTRARLADEEAAFRSGALVPGRLYVLLPGTPLPPARPGLEAVALDGVRLVRVAEKSGKRKVGGLTLANRLSS